jgi:hypothetical protein
VSIFDKSITPIATADLRGVPFLSFQYNEPNEIGAAPFDDTLSFEVETSSTALAADRDSVVGEIAKTAFWR